MGVLTHSCDIVMVTITVPFDLYRHLTFLPATYPQDAGGRRSPVARIDFAARAGRCRPAGWEACGPSLRLTRADVRCHRDRRPSRKPALAGPADKGPSAPPWMA
jgi:hypothetical protein